MAEKAPLFKSDILKVNMKELVTLINVIFETRLPIVIWGEKAVGKTTAVKDCADANGYRLEVLHLATQDIVDLIGMMTKTPSETHSKKLSELFQKSTMGQELSPDEYKFVKDMMLNQNLQTEWCRPAWLHDDGIKTIYFLDEMNRSNKFVSAAMLPFLIEGRIHRHRIGKDDIVIAACNPANARYAVNDSFEQDEALKDRCGHVILEPSLDEFLSYADSRLDPVTMSVLKKHTKFISVETFDVPFKVAPSRRSLINVLGIIGKKPNAWLKQNGKVAIGAYLGTDFLNVWWDTKFSKDQYIDIEDLINFNKNKNKIKDAISAIVNGKVTVKQDIYESSLDSMIDWCENSYKDGTMKLDWMTDYFSMDFIPKDSIAGFLSKINLLDKPCLIEHFLETSLLDQIPEINELKAFNK